MNDKPEVQPAPAKCNCSDVSGNSGPCPEHAARPAEFDDWWLSDGKFFDPDFSEVPWFDKRKELAEYAWHKARLSAQRLLATDNEMVCEGAIVEAANILTNTCQIIDVTKIEWSATSAWSDWDQSVRDAASEWLKKFHIWQQGFQSACSECDGDGCAKCCHGCASRDDQIRLLTEHLCGLRRVVVLGDQTDAYDARKEK